MKFTADIWPGIKYRRSVSFKTLFGAAANFALLVAKEDKIGLQKAGEEKFVYYLLTQVIFHFQRLKKLCPVLAAFLRRIRVKKIRWHTSFGLNDASRTGIATGYLWTLKGMMCIFINRRFKLAAPPDLKVTPLFTKQGFLFLIEFVAVIRLRHLLPVGFKAAAVFVNECGRKILFGRRRNYG